MSLLHKINALIQAGAGDIQVCLALSDTEIEAIFEVAVNHGNISPDNFGFEDRKNSVYGLIGVLVELHKMV